MASTTSSAIRSLMRTTIAALTPSALSGDGFRAYEERFAFRDWCDKNPAAALRLFSVRDVGELEPPLVTDTARHWAWREFVLEVAYPLDARYGELEELSLDDVIEQDLRQLRAAVGTDGFQTIEGAGARDAAVSNLPGEIRDRGVACFFAGLRFRVGFWEATS